MEIWARLRLFEPTWTGLFLMIGLFLATLFVRRALPEDRRHRGRLSLLFLGLAPVVHLIASGLDLLGLAPVAATLHLTSLFLLLAGTTGTVTLVGFDVLLGRSAIPTLARDVVQTTLFGALVFVVFRTAGLDPLSVVTTSAVLTAVLGLSLQSVIANTVAGVVLQVERSFALGDWIEVGSRVGRIAEIRWRSSTLMTREGDSALIPNLQLLSQEVVNLSRPSRSRRGVVRVPFHHRHSPGEVHEAVLPAVCGVPGVLAKPPPTCRPVEFPGGPSVIHEVIYWVEDLAEQPAIEGEVRQRVWYAAERAGLEGPCPAPVSVPPEGDDGTPAQRAELARRLRAVGRVTLFAPLSPEEQLLLARGMCRRRFARGEVILREGQPGSSLFVVDVGEVRVEVDAGAPGAGALACLGPGDWFGEMSLLTGEPRQATVTAERETTCDELDAEVLLPLLRSQPELADALSRRLVERQLVLEQTRDALSARSDELLTARSESVVRRVRTYFHLG